MMRFIWIIYVEWSVDLRDIFLDMSVYHKEGSSTKLVKEDDGGNENFTEVYFYKINDL